MCMRMCVCVCVCAGSGGERGEDVLTRMSARASCTTVNASVNKKDWRRCGGAA